MARDAASLQVISAAKATTMYFSKGCFCLQSAVPMMYAASQVTDKTLRNHAHRHPRSLCNGLTPSRETSPMFEFPFPQLNGRRTIILKQAAVSSPNWKVSSIDNMHSGGLPLKWISRNEQYMEIALEQAYFRRENSKNLLHRWHMVKIEVRKLWKNTMHPRFRFLRD